MKRMLHISAVCCCGLAMALLGTPVEAQKGGNAPSGQKSAQGNRGSSNNGGAQRGSSNRGSSDRGSSQRGSSNQGSSERGSSQKGSSERGSSEKSGQPPRSSGEKTGDRGASDRGSSERSGQPPRGSGEKAGERSPSSGEPNRGEGKRTPEQGDRGNRPEGDRPNPTPDQNRGGERPEMNRGDRAEEFRERMQELNKNRGEGERGENNRGDQNRPGEGNRPTERGQDRAQDNRPNPRGTDYLRNYLSGKQNLDNQNPNAQGGTPEERLRNQIEGKLDPRNQNRETVESRLSSQERLQNQQFRSWDNADQTAERIRNNFVQSRNQNRNQNVRFDQNFWRSVVRGNTGNNRVNGYFHVYGSLNGNRNYARNYWWQPTPANTLSSWLRGSYGQPRYYSYGPGGDVYCRNGYVYIGGNRHVTIPQYYTQAVHVVRSVPEISPEEAQEMEWKPLGVFALASDENQEASFIVQLAINQDGVLSGTFYDEKSKETRPLLGRVDEESQRAIWHFADEPEIGIVMETMLYNLSRDETNVLVHFGEETTESWLMVRIPEPEEE